MTLCTIVDILELSRIPFLDLFTARRLWQGLVFSIFMTLGKLLVGICIPISEMRLRRVPAAASEDTNGLREHAGREKPTMKKVNPDGKQRARWSVIWPGKASVAPAIMLGAAMVARGEIGSVISLRLPPSLIPCLPLF